jgi:hypothetical protein
MTRASNPEKDLYSFRYDANCGTIIQCKIRVDVICAIYMTFFFMDQ